MYKYLLILSITFLLFGFGFGQNLKDLPLDSSRINYSSTITRDSIIGRKQKDQTSAKATACSSTTTGTVPNLLCAEIGSLSYNTSYIEVDFLGFPSLASSNSPSVYGASNPSCWTAGTPSGEGTWNILDVESGVNAVSIKESMTSFINGNASFIQMTFYQGTNCSNLTEVACETFLEFDGLTLDIFDVFVSGIDDSQPLWIYTSSDGWFDLFDLEVIGFDELSNTSCNQAGSTNDGCNVGAPGATDWSGPSANGEMCFGTNCTYTLTLFDFNDNGWGGGGELRIRLDGIITNTFTIGNGQSGSSFTFSPLPNQLVEIFFHTGTFNEENAAVLTFSDGNSILLFDYFDYLGFPQNFNDIILQQNRPFCTQAWYSNENTVYYTITATDVEGEISVDNAICNDGTAGELQIGVWNACGDVGNYGPGSGFVGCAVGTGALELPTLTVGESYILVADGQAGDNCTWDFITTGVVLPVELIRLEANAYQGYNLISWSTASERNSDYFIVQKSIDGYDFFDLDTIKGSGHSTIQKDYRTLDYNQQVGTSYYRLKQVDYDGKFEYHGPKSLQISQGARMSLYPNPAGSNITVNYQFNKGKIYNYQILDGFGKIIRTDSFQSDGIQELKVKLDDLAAGFYFMVLYDQHGILDKSKFVKD